VRTRSQYGALSPAVAILAVMIFWLAGLVIDGARQLSARSRAIGYAQEAARAGASGLDLNAKQVKIDVKDATERINDYCATVIGNDSTITQCDATTIDDEQILVHVEINNPTTFLSMLGVGSLTAKGDGEAHAEQGVTKGDETIAVPSISMLPTDLPPTVRSESPSEPTFPTCVVKTITVPVPTVTEVPVPTPPHRPTATITVTQPTTVPSTVVVTLPPICMSPQDRTLILTETAPTSSPPP
jgi:type II secretory pathway pseudopilin PulG